MVKYQILYWHDIPLQVRVREDRQKLSKPLPARFQAAVDQAAMKAGVTSDDAYIEGLHWSAWEEREGQLADVATAVMMELDVRYEKIDWQETVAQLAQAQKG